ncbi:MAG: hypothetical protein ABIH76_07965 [Candidatus Bathyarchaeota archaeon]
MEIEKNLYWVGAVDWEERDFHFFEIPRGATYNAYLIIDDKITWLTPSKTNFSHN